jgi:nucleotide-binding universal stress UspA family protein
VVALDGETSAQPALSLAFTEASLRGCPVVALHAASYSASNEDVVEHHVGIAELIAGWKQDYPDVPVETSVVRGDADATLLAWSRNASALVVGRAHRRGWGTWTRSVARTVLEQAHCPLIIPGRASVSPDLVGGVPRRRPASGARR